MGEAAQVAGLANDHRIEQKGGNLGSTKRAKNSLFCHADGHMSSQECGFRTKNSEVQWLGCAPR